jgi:hypothetical protein
MFDIFQTKALIEAKKKHIFNTDQSAGKVFFR